MKFATRIVNFSLNQKTAPTFVGAVVLLTVNDEMAFELFRHSQLETKYEAWYNERNDEKK